MAIKPIKTIKIPLPLKVQENMIADKSNPSKFFYDFGLKKTPSNLYSLLTDAVWTHLIGKWVYSLSSDSYTVPIFYKHVCVESRLVQIVFSGDDFLGDGIYTIYSAWVYVGKDNLWVEPDEYSLDKGSDECKNFLKYLTKYRYISKEELRIFQNVATRGKYRNSIPQIIRPTRM